jgi:hypothetical protein
MGRWTHDFHVNNRANLSFRNEQCIISDSEGRNQSYAFNRHSRKMGVHIGSRQPGGKNLTVNDSIQVVQELLYWLRQAPTG